MVPFPFSPEHSHCDCFLSRIPLILPHLFIRRNSTTPPQKKQILIFNIFPCLKGIAVPPSFRPGLRKYAVLLWHRPDTTLLRKPPFLRGGGERNFLIRESMRIFSNLLKSGTHRILGKKREKEVQSPEERTKKRKRKKCSPVRERTGEHQKAP